MRCQTSPYSSSNRPRGGALQQHQLLALPSLHSGQVAPPRTGPGAQMRALEKFRPVWNATARSGRIWKLEATKGRHGPGELLHFKQDPLSSEGGRVRWEHEGGVEVAAFMHHPVHAAKKRGKHGSASGGIGPGRRGAGLYGPGHHAAGQDRCLRQGRRITRPYKPVWYPRLVPAAITPPLHRTMAPAASAAAKLSAPQAVCKKTATKRQTRAAPRPPQTPQKKKSRARGITPRRVAAPPKRTGAPRRTRPRRRANK